ncbi:cellulose binding domain-containing protein [Streptomyces sp. NPDC048362]|uniref:cellulose binding domain-containing protein n=1 Tax=Streptomyces sp. NPDC048362 TaxID=3365539 RepID=UPI00372159B0
MPDLPTPQDVTEAALFSEGWDAVLSYADLCTAGSVTVHQLATEAFTLGMREVRAAASTHVRGAGRRTARLPTIPALLTAVRDTAVAWEAGGQGHKLDPDLRLWLNSDAPDRFSGPPLRRPVALRGLRDMQEADASLLWLAEVEALPLPAVARRLGLDPAAVAGELDQVRALFRDRCHRAHLDTPMDAECRSYARLLDAVTRSAAVDTPEDLSRHLATCVRCAEAAACLRLHGGGLPAALAGGVVGWGGLAYLERRRRAAEVRLVGAGRPGADAGADPTQDAGRGRAVRRGLLATAVVLSALALGASLVPSGGSGQDIAAARDDRRPVAGPGASLGTTHHPLPAGTSAPASPASAAPTSGTGHPTAPERREPDPEPQGTSSATHRPARTGAPAPTEATTCRVTYQLVNQWNEGFQATVTLTTDHALAGWQVAWSFPDGQRVGQMWDATAGGSGAHVTATAANYDKSVAAHASVSFGFVGTWRERNRAPHGFTLNGAPCATR